MNDRFKFRIWNTNLKQMYYFNDTSLLKFKKNSWYLTFGNDIVASSLDGDIIMQCTGFKDSNENLIYEGDFVELSERNNKALILFQDGAFGYQYRGIFHTFSNHYTLRFIFNKIIIKGNIYEAKGISF